MRQIVAILAVVVGLAGWSSVSAQTEKGMEELGFGASYTGGDVRASGQAMLTYGYFFQKDWQAGLSASVSKVEEENPVGSASGLLSLYLPSPTARSAPYFGMEIGTGYGKIRPEYILGGFIGVKEYLFGDKEKVGGSLWLQISYRKLFMNRGNDIELVAGLAGMSLFFD